MSCSSEKGSTHACRWHSGSCERAQFKISYKFVEGQKLLIAADEICNYFVSERRRGVMFGCLDGYYQTVLPHGGCRKSKAIESGKGNH